MTIKSPNKPITVKMQLTEKDWVSYQRFKWVKGKRHQFKQMFLLFIVFVGFPVFAFYNMASAALDPQRNTWVGSYYILILALYFFYKWFIVYPLKYRHSPALYLVKMTVEFNDQNIKVIMRSPQYNSEKTIAFSDLQKVYELKSYFYLTQVHQAPLILSTENLANRDTLRKFLSSVIGDKIVDCR